MIRPIRCIIVDDKPLAIELIQNYIQQIPFLSLVHKTTNPMEALVCVDSGLADLVFLDIQMPELSGVQFMKMTESKVGIILITAYSEYALEGFEHQALDYLLKPVSFERFYKAALRARDYFPGNQNHIPLEDNSIKANRDYFFIKTDYKIVKVFFADIKYVEAMQNYTIVHTMGDRIITLQTLKQMEAQLPVKDFIRIHKSYIVNMRKIDTIEKNIVVINETRIRIGETYQKAFFEALKQQ